LVSHPDGGYTPGRHMQPRIEASPDIALFTDFWCPPAAYLFRRAIIDKTEGWNEELPIIQDARFVLDCALHGAAFVRSTGVTAYYRVHTAGSVSTSNRPAFVRDRLRNAADIEVWWRQHGGLSSERTNALLKVYGQVARDSFEGDSTLFEEALAALQKLNPQYAPAHPWHLAATSRMLGYRRAEGIAARYRRAKRWLGLRRPG
jgi:hypothetical protein